MEATSHMYLFKLKLTKIEDPISQLYYPCFKCLEAQKLLTIVLEMQIPDILSSQKFLLDGAGLGHALELL
jgi:hypothetical protein